MRLAWHKRTAGMGPEQLASLVKTHWNVAKGAAWERLDAALYNNRNTLSGRCIQLCDDFRQPGIDGYLMKNNRMNGTVQYKAGTIDYIRGEMRKRGPEDSSIFRVPKGTEYTGPGADRVVEGAASRKELARALRNASTPGPSTFLHAVGRSCLSGALIGALVEAFIGSYHVMVKRDRSWGEVAWDVLWTGAIGGSACGAAVAVTTIGVGFFTAATWPVWVISIPVSMGAMWVVRTARDSLGQTSWVIRIRPQHHMSCER